MHRGASRQLPRPHVPRTAPAVVPFAHSAPRVASWPALWEGTVGVLQREAAEALRLLDRGAMEAAAAKAAAHGYRNADLYDIGEKLKLGERQFVQLQAHTPSPPRRIAPPPPHHHHPHPHLSPPRS